MTGAVPCHEPEANEARSQPTPHRSNQSDNAAPCGYAALGWSASTGRLQIGLNNLPGITSTPATQPLSKRPLSPGYSSGSNCRKHAERRISASNCSWMTGPLPCSQVASRIICCTRPTGVATVRCGPARRSGAMVARLLIKRRLVRRRAENNARLAPARRKRGRVKCRINMSLTY